MYIRKRLTILLAACMLFTACGKGQTKTDASPAVKQQEAAEKGAPGGKTAATGQNLSKGGVVAEGNPGPANPAAADHEAGAEKAGQQADPLPLSYAHEFRAERYPDGSFDIHIGEDDFHFDGPQDNIYLAASSAMDLFLKAGAISSVKMTGTKPSDWGIPEIREMVETDQIVYAGKYSAPDYEYLVSEGCGLAIESTMIYHNPDVKEKLESLGIPVLVERSSYETDPLGRMEWIKLYGLLTGHLEEACAYFDRSIAALSDVLGKESTGKKAAFFYISTNGSAIVRKPGDYVSKMIGMAGGEYILQEDGSEAENALSTMNMQMEAFVEAARDADVLIYNSSIDGELFTLEDLFAKSALLKDFQAVRTGEVYCTGKNMFQETSAFADMIREMHLIFTGEAAGAELQYFHRLQ